MSATRRVTVTLTVEAKAECETPSDVIDPYDVEAFASDILCDLSRGEWERSWRITGVELVDAGQVEAKEG